MIGESLSCVQANTGFLWVAPNGTGQNTELGMLTGTSPAISIRP